MAMPSGRGKDSVCKVLIRIYYTLQHHLGTLYRLISCCSADQVNHTANLPTSTNIFHLISSVKLKVFILLHLPSNHGIDLNITIYVAYFAQYVISTLSALLWIIDCTKELCIVLSLANFIAFASHFLSAE